MFAYGSVQGSGPESPQIELVCVSPLDAKISISVTAVIDTGSVRTCVPARYLAMLSEAGGLDYRRVRVNAVIGHYECREVIIDARIAQCEFKDLKVIEIERPYAVVGRDILNAYKMTLDPRRGLWEVDKPC